MMLETTRNTNTIIFTNIFNFLSHTTRMARKIVILTTVVFIMGIINTARGAQSRSSLTASG